MYGEIAAWWHLLSAPADYAEEAAFFVQVLTQACQRPPRTVLELGSGGGNNASHLKLHYEITLVELSPGMMALSREINPECEHIHGDMRSVRLGRVFDAVFIHDAIIYMTTVDDLRKAIKTAYAHCRNGGVALFVPDHTRETFHPSTGHGGHDGERRGMRYLEWTFDPDPTDTTTITEYAYLLREENGEVSVAYDRHVCGLFPREEWVRLLQETGFEVQVVLEPYDRELFVGVKSP